VNWKGLRIKRRSHCCFRERGMKATSSRNTEETSRRSKTRTRENCAYKRRAKCVYKEKPAHPTAMNATPTRNDGFDQSINCTNNVHTSTHTKSHSHSHSHSHIHAHTHTQTHSVCEFWAEEFLTDTDRYTCHKKGTILTLK
jgi:hypothetical protein